MKYTKQDLEDAFFYGVMFAIDDIDRVEREAIFAEEEAELAYEEAVTITLKVLKERRARG